MNHARAIVADRTRQLRPLLRLRLRDLFPPVGELSDAVRSEAAPAQICLRARIQHSEEQVDEERSVQRLHVICTKLGQLSNQLCAHSRRTKSGPRAFQLSVVARRKWTLQHLFHLAHEELKLRAVLDTQGCKVSGEERECQPLKSIGASNRRERRREPTAQKLLMVGSVAEVVSDALKQLKALRSRERRSRSSKALRSRRARSEPRKSSVSSSEYMILHWPCRVASGRARRKRPPARKRPPKAASKFRMKLKIMETS